MKKTLIALTIASFGAPAFAATANVELYGRVTASVDIVDRDNAAQDDEFKVSSNNSHFGFRGSEDLGGGLSAIWQYETRFMVDDGTGFGTDMRNTFIGLSHQQFGTVKLGRHDTAYKLSTGKYDVFFDSMGDYNAVMGADANGGAGAIFDIREPDSVTYLTPTFAGLTGMVSYGQRNEAGATASDPQLWSLAVSYANGPFTLAAAYEAHDDVSAMAGSTTSFLRRRAAATGLAGSLATDTSDDNGWRVGGSYAFGNTTVAAVYERLESDGVLGGVAASVERDAWYLSATHKMGAITLKGAYAQAGDTDGAVNVNDGATQWTLGADYALSKRTNAYALYSSMKNDVAGAYTLGTSNNSAQFVGNGAGNDPSGISIGLRHNF